MPFVILFSRILSRILNFFGFGATSLIGKIALKLKPNILYHISKNTKIICVTGTNGKTTTCAMIEQGMKANNMSYFINKSGANMISGVVTSFIKNCDAFGKCKKEYAILECDENSFPIISTYINPMAIVVTNVFRDQLDRYAEVNTTLTKIVRSINNSPKAMLVLNVDCPITFSITNFCKNNYVLFGIDSDKSISAPMDSVFCPICNSRLYYRKNLFAHIGDYYCKCCDFKREKPSYIASELKDNNGQYSFELKGRNHLLQIGGIYNVYNYLASVTVLDNLGVDYSSLESFGGSFGRLETFYFNDKKITLMLVKNPVGFANCIDYANSLDYKYNCAFALNDNDADGRDVSWIWDVNFYNLKRKLLDVYTFGTRCYDMTLRLKYDEIESIPYEDNTYNKLVDLIKDDDENYVIFASYTAMMTIRHKFIEAFGGEEFWR